MSYFLMSLLALTGAILIFIILLQRGRGGGLAGAFGGLGGQSAFGTKAGDVFTKITIGVTVVWVILAGVSVVVLRAQTGQSRYVSDEPTASSMAEPGDRTEPGATDDGAAEPKAPEDGATEDEAGRPDEPSNDE